MTIKVHELLKFCWDHGYWIDVVPVANYEVRLDVVEPTGKIMGSKTFHKEPKTKNDIGYHDKILELYKKCEMKILTKKSSKKLSKK